MIAAIELGDIFLDEKDQETCGQCGKDEFGYVSTKGTKLLDNQRSNERSLK